jgi:pyruvate carboxylase subunit B
MRYFVTVAGRTFEVDLSGAVPKVDGRAVNAELRDVPGTTLRHLLADGRSLSLVLRPGAERGSFDVHVAGRHYTVQVVDERTRAIREMTGRGGAPRGPRPLRAPMPGMVVRIEVQPGQTVQPGQGVVIVEAMKMENELKAETGGVVSRIHVAPGKAVEKGAVLVEFEAT